MCQLVDLFTTNYISAICVVLNCYTQITYNSDRQKYFFVAQTRTLFIFLGVGPSIPVSGACGSGLHSDCCFGKGIQKRMRGLTSMDGVFFFWLSNRA